MKLAKYIGELLFEYECIVIPEFGGFISKEVPAQILPIQDHFMPPSKEIVFNVHLKTNDGLLVNYIARKEKLTYIEARTAVERFAKKCKLELENGKRIRFRKVGYLYLDRDKNICFEADKTQNYLADSFGLKSFVSPNIKRTSNYTYVKRSTKVESKQRTPKETIQKEEHKHKVKKEKKDEPKYININISAIIFLVAIAAITVFKFSSVKTLYNNYAGYIPILSNAENRNVSEQGETRTLGVLTLIDKLTSKKKKKEVNKSGKVTPRIENEGEAAPEKENDIHIKNQKDTLESDKEDYQEKTKGTLKESENKEAEKVNENDAVHITKTEIQEQTNKYFIIAGVFCNKMNAERLVLNLKSKGYKASIVGQTKTGNYRVCFDAFSNKLNANKQLAIIRKNENDEAWLLNI